MLAMSLLFGTSYGMYNPIFPIFATEELGATYEDLGLLGMVSFLPYVFVPLLMGITMDKINSRYLLTAGFATHALSVYLMTVATTIEEIILYRIMAGIAHALVWPPALNAVSHDPDTRVKYTALFTMFFVVGYMVGPLIGSFILDAANLDYSMLFMATAYVMGAGVVSILLNYPVRRTVTGHGSRLDLHLFRDILKLPALLVILLYSTATFGLVLALYPVSMHERGLDSATIMQLYAIFGVTRIVAFLLAKWIARSRGVGLILSTACVVIAMAISAVSTTAVEFAIAMLLLGFGFASMYPLALSIVLASSRKIASERLVGAYESIFGLGWTSGPLAAGYIGHVLGSTGLYLTLFAVGLGVLLLTLLFRNRMYTTIRELKYEAGCSTGRIVSIKQQLKNNFGIVLTGIGLMDMELKKMKEGEAHDEIPANLQHIHDTITGTITRTNEMLDTEAVILNSALVKNIRELLSQITEINPVSGAGSGYPKYDTIKERTIYCTNRLDTIIGDDAVLK